MVLMLSFPRKQEPSYTVVKFGSPAFAWMTTGAYAETVSVSMWF